MSRNCIGQPRQLTLPRTRRPLQFRPAETYRRAECLVTNVTLTIALVDVLSAVGQDSRMSEPNGALTIHTNGSPDDLLQLLDWFRDDDVLRGRVSLAPPRIRDGQMGDLYDVLMVAAGAGGFATALTRSLSTWLTHRRSDITITVKHSGGAQVTLDAQRVKTPEVLQQLRSLLDEADNP